MTERPPSGSLGRLFAALVGSDGPNEAGGQEDLGQQGLSVDDVAGRIVGSKDPLGELEAVCRAVEDADADPALPVSRLVRRLRQGGLGTDDVEVADVTCVRPPFSGLPYLRMADAPVPYLAKLRVLAAESAVNTALLAERALPEGAEVTYDALVRAEQRVLRSVCAQAPNVAARLEEPPRGEWAVRHAISFGIESMRLPHRLTARFRVNVAAGACAIECDLTPPSLFSHDAYVPGLGVVAATRDMRRRAATDYNLRVGILLASYALLACEELEHVWVAGVLDTPAAHQCLYSVCVERYMLEGLDLTGSFDPVALMRGLEATMDEDHGQLGCVTQGFSLEDELFCPRGRFEAPELSHRELPEDAARALGTRTLRGLAADEARAREQLAEDVSRGLTDSTEKNVRLMLDLAAGYDDPTVLPAARACAARLIDGTLAEEAEAISEAIVEGDALSEAVARAHKMLEAQQVLEAQRLLEQAVWEVELEGRYLDGPDCVWRSFGSHVDRALFGRLRVPEGVEVRLAPDAYVEAHAIIGGCALAQGQTELACAHARRVRELAPMSGQAAVGLAHCLQALGDLVGAEDVIRDYLECAHDADGLGAGYLHMSQIQWSRGHMLAAQACYQRACRYVKLPMMVAGMQVVAILGNLGEGMEARLSPERVDEALTAHKIPAAPTQEVADAFFECMRAATDAECFGVAREFMVNLVSLWRDDVYTGMLRSIEREPDR